MRRPAYGSAFDGKRSCAQRNSSAYDDNGAVGEADYFLRNAPEKEAGQPAMTTAADDDQISPTVGSGCNDFMGRVAETGLGRNTLGGLHLSPSASGGRPDLAGRALPAVKAPTLLIVGGDDVDVLSLNRAALVKLRCEKKLAIVPSATRSRGRSRRSSCTHAVGS
jgi:hypothetical protein